MTNPNFKARKKEEKLYFPFFEPYFPQNCYIFRILLFLDALVVILIQTKTLNNQNTTPTPRP